MKDTEFAEAVRRGMEMDRDLRDELERFDEYQITPNDAEVICEALQKLPRPEDYRDGGLFSTLSTLVHYFQSSAQQELAACKVLYDKGIPQIVRIFEEMSANPDVYQEEDDTLMLLKMCAWYQHPLGSELLLKAALIPFKPNEFLWHTTFYTLAKDHPHRDIIFEGLRQKLPTGFLCVSFLDSANRAVQEGGLLLHPFDSPEGYSRLEGYLLNRDPSEFSYAVSASAALPYLREPARTQLMALAMDHVDKAIQLEAAMSAARLGSTAGVRVLVRFAEDVNYSMEAVGKLIELGKEVHITSAMVSEEFRARAEFAHWLRHPNELGRPPTSLEVVDHRKLYWPPTGDRKSLYLIKYRMLEEGGCELDHADTDCGLVGSVTFCLFGANNHQRAPEDVYAIHCSWELEIKELITRESVAENQQQDGVLPQIDGKDLSETEYLHKFRFAESVSYPGNDVIVISGKLAGESGWLLLDGERSMWYPEAEQPGDGRGDVVARLHIGRVLLGFEDTVDRKSFFETQQPPASEFIVRVYEDLLEQARGAKETEQAMLLGGAGPLDKHFGSYVKAKADVSHKSAEVALVEAFESIFEVCEQAVPAVIPSLFWRYSIVPSQLEAYVKAKHLTNKEMSQDIIVAELFERFLCILQRAEKPQETKLLDTLGVLADKFEWFMNAYIACGKQERVSQLIAYLGQYWDKPCTDSMLGRIAYAIGDKSLAEKYLVRLLDRKKTQLRMVELSLLAEIWYRQGKVDPAEDLLSTCINNLTREIATCKYQMDLNQFQETYQQHRNVFLRLFPNKLSKLPELVLPKHPLS